MFSSNTDEALGITIRLSGPQAGAEISERQIVDEQDLKVYLSQDVHVMIIVIPQEYSWGVFSVTKSFFEQIMTRLNVAAGFLEVMSGYGVKTLEDERVFYGWDSPCARFSCPGGKHELYYNIPYIARQEGRSGDFWVLRQTGVYHQWQNETDTSRWIFVALRPHQRTAILEAVKSSSHHCPRLIHAQLQVALASEWSAFIEYLFTRLHALSDIASYAGIDQEDKRGFAVSHQDLQDLFTLQIRIERAMYAVECCIKIGEASRDHFTSHAGNPQTHLPPCDECTGVMNKHQLNMARYSRSLQRLDRRLSNTMEVVSKMLLLRNEFLLHKAANNSGEALKALVVVNQQSKAHQETLSETFQLVQADSVLLKLLSMVATVYLPASLVATIFSSNLISSVASSNEQDPPRLVLSPQFWTYVTIALPLMAITFSWTIYVDKRARRKALSGAGSP